MWCLNITRGTAWFRTRDSLTDNCNHNHMLNAESWTATSVSIWINMSAFSISAADFFKGWPTHLKIFSLHISSEKGLNQISWQAFFFLLYLKRIKHSFSCNDDLFRLLFNWQWTNQGCHFFCCLPLGQLEKEQLCHFDNTLIKVTNIRINFNPGKHHFRFRRKTHTLFSITRHTCPKRFCPAHTDVWMIFKNSCPVRGLKIKMAPLIGFVVKLPSNVWIENGKNLKTNVCASQI